MHQSAYYYASIQANLGSSIHPTATICSSFRYGRYRHGFTKLGILQQQQPRLLDVDTHNIFFDVGSMGHFFLVEIMAIAQLA